MSSAEERFTALFEATRLPLLAYAVRRVADPADAADVVAETYLVAWRRLDDVPAGADARPWLFGVARRVLAGRGFLETVTWSFMHHETAALMIGGAGDGLQGIKRGIMEAADLIAITKTDGDNDQRNHRAAMDLRQAIALLPPAAPPPRRRPA